jgi:Protein of unknown function (DUF3800)
VLRAYFDESGTTGGARIMTVVGVVATPARWKLLERAWRRMLKAEGIREFKAADCVAGENEFEGWSQRRRDAFRSALAREIDRRALVAVACGLVRKDFRAWVLDHSHKTSWARNAYMWCLRGALETLAYSAHRGRQRVAVVLDEGVGGQDKAIRHFRRAMEKDAELQAAFFGSFTTAASIEFAPLQAADLMAYELRHHAERKQGIPKRYASLSPAFHRLPIEGGVFDGESWEAIQRDLIRLRGEGC